MNEVATLQNLTVRDVLRRRTMELHEQLHLHSSFVDLFAQNSNLRDYRALMQRLYGFYAPLDTAIEQTIVDMPSGAMGGFVYEKRSDHLAQDLADLGFSPGEIAATSQCQQVFDVVSQNSLSGVFYVIEGATLGGSRIDRAAQRLLDQDAPTGRRFWNWCRSNGQRRWAMAREHLALTPSNTARLSEITAGALGTFSALSAWLAPLDRAQDPLARGHM